jgi:MFS family permease
VFFDPLYFKLIRDQSAFYVGLTLLSVTVIQVIISLMLAKLLKLFSVYQLLVFGIAATAISAFIHVFFHSGTSIIIILLAMILMGYTWGIANAGGITAITNTVDAAETGTAIGTIFTLWNLSGAIFLALSTVIFHLGEHATMSHYFHQNHIILKEGQHSQIRRLLSDPDQALQILKHLSIPNPQVVFNYFKLSFLNGYHWAYWFCTLISIIALLLGLLLRPQKPV